MTASSTPPCVRRAALATGLGLALLGLGCTTAPAPADLEAPFQAMLRSSFRDEGIAKVDRLQQEPGQLACSSGQPLDAATAARLQAEALASVKPPSDGRYLGDWREGEKLAQSGRGMTWSDRSSAASANGGSCYNCHQLTKAEISFGTIGPSLYQYGKLRGVTDPASAQARPMVEYTWSRLYNAWSHNACSNMPRFGHKGLLDEQQLRHLMALLLDPASAVNQ